MAQIGEPSPAVDGSCEVAGRRVDYCLYGSASAWPVVFEYGTPGTRWLSGQLIDAVARAGVQLLVLDRPGYGTSSRRSGRRIIDVVEDVAAVVAALGWEESRYGEAFWCGAPHALACGDAAPPCHRVRQRGRTRTV